MRNIALTASLFALTATLFGAVEPSYAASHRDRHQHRRYVEHRRSQACVRHKANNGTAIGAVTGGLLGNVIAGHGSRTGGTIIGAGVGAVAGHQIAKNNARC